MNFIDLCAGIGGIRWGMEKAGHKCIGYAECDTYCSQCKEYTRHHFNGHDNHTNCEGCGTEKKQYARYSYQAIHETKGEWTGYDISTISDESIRRIGRTDIICAGFPCQTFSVAGKREGFSNIRGTVFFEIMRFTSILRPKYLFLENVKGLLNHDDGTTFETIIRTLDEAGYDTEWSVLNSKYFGVAHNRERTFIIASLRGVRTSKVFPFRGEDQRVDMEQPKITIFGNTKREHQTSVGQRDIVYDAIGIMGSLMATDYKQPKQIAIPVLSPDRVKKRQNGRRFKENQEEMFTLTAQDRHGIMVVGNLPGKHEQCNRVYSVEGISPALLTMQGGGQEPKILIKEATKKGYAEAEAGDSVNLAHPKSKTRRGCVGKKIANTLLTNDSQGVVNDSYYIRKLTPLECFRLQGTPDEFFYRAKYLSKDVARNIISKKLNHYEVSFEQKMSDSQLYKQAGNGVTWTLIYELAKRL